MCGLPHHRLLYGSKSAYGSANAAAGALRGHGGSRQDWFSGTPLGSLLTEGTNRANFEILEEPVVSVEGRKVQGIVFTDPKSNMNLITHKLAQQLQIERGLTKIIMKTVNKDYSEREVKLYCLGVEDAKRQIHWMEAVGMESITESVRLYD